MSTAINALDLANRNEISKLTAPLHGQVICNTSAGSRIFTFSANGSDERQKFVDLYQYFADELAAGRRVYAAMGAGDYGFDGNGLQQLFQAGSQGLVWTGMGPEVTRIGYVGDTESGNIWRIAEWEPDVDAVKSVIGITQAAGVATVNITAHGAVEGETVRIYNSDQTEYNGLQVVTGITDEDNFTFSVDSGTVSPATGTITCAIHSQFLRDFAICNMQFMDTNPSAHRLQPFAGDTPPFKDPPTGAEETHGIQMKQSHGLRMQNMWADSVGDEAIELIYAEDFEVSSFRSRGTPSEEQSGGGAISIKNGCHHGLVDKFIIGNIGSTSASTYGVNLKNVVHPEPSSDIKITNGFVINPVTSGIRMNTSSSDIARVKIGNVTVVGGENALAEGGSGFLLSEVRISDFTCIEQTGKNVDINRALADAADITIKDSTFDGSRHATNTLPNVQVNGSNIKLIDNDYKNAAMAVYSSQSVDVLVQGGTSDNNGETGVAYPVVYDQTSSGNMVVDGLKVINSQSTGTYFRGVHTVKNCPEMSSLNEQSLGAATAFTNFDNNKKVVTKLLTASIEGGSASDNEFEPLTNPSVIGTIQVTADWVNVDNNSSTQTANPIIRLDDCLRCTANGNKMPAIASGNGIIERVATAADYNTITGNQLNGRPVVVVGANTIGADVVVPDAGAGTTTIKFNL